MKRKAFVSIFAFFVVIVLLIMGGIGMQRAINDARAAQRDRLNTEAFYLAEGGISLASYTLAYNIANHIPEPVTGTDYFNNSISDFLSSGFDVQIVCTPLGNERAVIDSLGIVNFIREYQISSSVTHPTSDVAISTNQIVARKKIYTFQHAVFYVDDLEMLPGPDMTLSGKVHSNSDIYIGTHNTFTIDSEYLYSVGDIYNMRKDSSSSMNGDVSIKISGTSSYELMKVFGEPSPLDGRRADWTTESQNRWQGTVKSADHGVTSLTAPSVGSIQPDGFYASNADLRIIKTAGGSWEVHSGGSAIAITDLPTGTIVERNFTDNREGQSVAASDIDISKLNQAETYDDANSNGQYDVGETYADDNSNGQYDPSYFPSNGLLYVSRADASTSQPNGVRLVNGGELNSGLTVVSNNPVYVKGDYNNINKKPAAVICDAVNILSNSWDDSKSSQSLNNRVASNTQINLAFIAGITPTDASSYSGGLENYPRLHEKWSGRTLLIRGSFVELWFSEIAQGDWSYGNPIYKAPRRDWNYDTDFNDSSNLPPFTPFAVETESIAWWKS